MISILLPSTGREKRLHELLTIMEPALPDKGEIIVILDQADIVDRETYDALGWLLTGHLRTRFIIATVRGCWRCKNVALRYALHDLIMWTADDVKPHQGWLEKGMECFRLSFPNGLGLVALNDLHGMEKTAGHVITTRKFLTVLFGYPYFPPKFRHYFLDTLVSDRSKSLNRYHFCTDAVMEHMHWRLGKSERDATNERNEGLEERNSDKSIKEAMDNEWLAGDRQKALRRLRN